MCSAMGKGCERQTRVQEWNLFSRSQFLRRAGLITRCYEPHTLPEEAATNCEHAVALNCRDYCDTESSFCTTFDRHYCQPEGRTCSRPFQRPCKPRSLLMRRCQRSFSSANRSTRASQFTQFWLERIWPMPPLGLNPKQPNDGLVYVPPSLRILDRTRSSVVPLVHGK